MEIPQQQRLFEAEGRKPTHDFLSLYSHSTAQQDPRPTSQGSLRTHDFLLPLERVEDGGAAKEENPVEISSSVEKSAPTSVEHILPGGIGTYSISHISYYNQRVPKPEGGSPIFTVAQTSSTDKNEEHSNCSSYTGSGFTLWEESALKKGKTGKENVGERSNNNSARDAAPKVGAHWTTSERLSQLSTNNQYSSFSSLSSSQPTGQKSQSFMEMIQSAKGCSQDDNLDEDDEFVLKKETPSPIHKGELRVKVDGKSTDQKANTPRSKHSATEQRRRSKINDRFQTLRELIPHGDQKRDKASFLLEVIEYVQFLQEKVQKYEGSYQAWNQEPAKLMPWKNGNRPGENYVDQSRGINGAAASTLLFAANLDEKSISLSPTITGGAHNAVESEMNSAATFKALDHHHGKAMPFPMSLQPNVFSSGKTSGTVAQMAPRIILDDENMATQPHSHHTRSCSSDGFADAGDKLKEQELTIEGGTINISSVYSQGLLNTLTQALQSTGVDLSGASISVQIDLGKQASRRPSIPTSMVKDNKVASSNQGLIRTRVSSAVESNNQAQKKLKTSRVP
ncbi:basic helix-loop-helix (bHLH) DNA-binding superfamily protein [Euphorbia peplus]|nr:basic helix-loop-helix (bHLH) DNA-binding superfamily protein [Euphorbia peplus]